MSLELTPADRANMPPPSVELYLIAVLARSLIKTMSPAKRTQFMMEVFNGFGELENINRVVQIRGPEHEAAARRLRREALAWGRMALTANFMLDAAAGRVITPPLKRKRSAGRGGQQPT